jgi:hypothetical protein
VQKACLAILLLLLLPFLVLCTDSTGLLKPFSGVLLSVQLLYQQLLLVVLIQCSTMEQLLLRLRLLLALLLLLLLQNWCMTYAISNTSTGENPFCCLCC